MGVVRGVWIIFVFLGDLGWSDWDGGLRYDLGSVEIPVSP